jgi:peroxiredoxin
MSLAVGARFPIDITVDTAQGPVRLSNMLAPGPLVVAFHRLWCPFCQQAARELASVQDQLDAAGAHVAIVYREDATQLQIHAPNAASASSASAIPIVSWRPPATLNASPSPATRPSHPRS